MIIDKKGRLFGKVSVIDLFVVVMIALIVVYGVFRFGNSRGIGIFETPRKITLTITTDVPGEVQAAVEAFTATRVQIGDPVAVVGSGVDWGSVTDVTVEPFIDYNHDHNGIMVGSPIPDRFLLTVETVTEGYDFQNGVWINGHVFLIGETQVVSVGDTNIFISIKDIVIE